MLSVKRRAAKGTMSLYALVTVSTAISQEVIPPQGHFTHGCGSMFLRVRLNRDAFVLLLSSRKEIDR